MKAFIITGTSKGLGNSIARKLVDINNHIFCISRTKDESLISYAKEKQCQLKYLDFDLSNVNEIEGMMISIFEKLNLSVLESISLVNNAGLTLPNKRIEDCEASELINNVHVNLMAPILLTSSFMRRIKTFEGDKKVINISSGSGKKPYHGWSSYCASKAGIDLFTQCVALEQSSKNSPVKILSLAPFIMDTDMQKEIRESDKEGFELVDTFIKYKEDGKLLTVDFVADKVIKLLLEGDYEQGGVMDVRQVK